MSVAVMGQLLSACTGAYSAASSAVWWAASLPPMCRESLAHAALTCSGATPRYFTPDFGPLALAWGWLLLGVLGLVFRRTAAAMVALAGGRAPQCALCSWEALLRELAARTQEPNRHEVLQYSLQEDKAAARVVASDEPHTYSADGPFFTDSTVADAAALRPANASSSPTQRASLSPPHAACAGESAAASDIDEWTLIVPRVAQPDGVRLLRTPMPRAYATTGCAALHAEREGATNCWPERRLSDEENGRCRLVSPSADHLRAFMLLVPQALPHLDVGLMETSTGADVANVPPVGLSQPWCESHKAEASWDPRADLAPHVATTANAVDYEVVIPTYGRWKPSHELAPNRARLKDWKEAFILDHTLSFLAREAVPKNRVTLFVATDEEAENYRKALQGSDWADVRITVSAPGIRDSRNFIYKHFPADTYVVSLDDDIEGIKWKVREGNTDAACIDLPPGNFVKIIYDAYKRMKEQGAYLWGLSTSQNPRALSLTVCSLRNGLINGYLHGFICRPDAASDLLRRLSDAIEDAEFSVRHFAKDGAVLRYRMYAGRTSPFANSGGLQSKFQASNARKTEEWCGAQQLHELFPSLIGAPSEESDPAGVTATTQVKFIFGPVKRHPRTIRRLGGLGRFMVPILKAKKRKSIREMRSMLARAKAFITKGKKAARTAAQNSSAVELAARRKKRMEMRAETALACDRKIISTQAWDLMDEDTLRFAANTKTPGSASHRRYAKYSKARTVKQAMSLGWRNDDRRFDITHGFAKIVTLDTKPASSECLVEDEQRVIPATPAGRAVPIRLAEVVEKNPGINLSRALVWPLLSRCPAFDVAAKGCWAKLAAKNGLLAEVPLPIFRILLHWGNTGCLAFARAQGPALSAALRPTTYDFLTSRCVFILRYVPTGAELQIDLRPTAVLELPVAGDEHRVQFLLHNWHTRSSVQACPNHLDPMHQCRRASLGQTIRSGDDNEHPQIWTLAPNFVMPRGVSRKVYMIHMIICRARGGGDGCAGPYHTTMRYDRDWQVLAVRQSLDAAELGAPLRARLQCLSVCASSVL
ncbi:hypothetical protein AK812_SmicGene35783 [Symbiodinium microadriaticum]|uniref:Uncharacterized protein n=1 Tax=Symbiodinium microadriaticum TaxID=2951 RepID=A0A1Q9CKR7_SYMMI|nr:hypothetical protein AK812_SmicGene35783 [Symbiodinium microadriaticum]